jgi:hypothetical protein
VNLQNAARCNNKENYKGALVTLEFVPNYFGGSEVTLESSSNPEL